LNLIRVMPAKGRPVLGRLHLITDDRPGRHPLALAELALAAGAGVVQVRSKVATARELMALTTAVVDRCARYGALCVVDDRLDVALAAGAGGVHLGEDDLPVAAARLMVRGDFVIGATARDPGQAVAAVAAGASYVGVGPCFPTATKAGLPPPIGVEGLAAVAAAVTVPVIAIGGVNAGRVPELLAGGAYGVAVVDAVSGAPDPAAATRRLVEALGRP
jgi:thiamine-phosphate pyrophosphorylase